MALAVSASVAQVITIEAESGLISAPFVMTNGYIYQPIETGLTNGGRAVLEFTITNSGDYQIQARVNAPDGSTNSFFVSINAEPQDPASIWVFPPTSGFADCVVTLGRATNSAGPTIFNLAEGAHQLILRGRGANAQLDWLQIQKTLAPPSNLRIGERPAPPEGLRVVLSE